MRGNVTSRREKGHRNAFEYNIREFGFRWYRIVYKHQIAMKILQVVQKLRCVHRAHTEIRELVSCTDVVLEGLTRSPPMVFYLSVRTLLWLILFIQNPHCLYNSIAILNSTKLRLPTRVGTFNRDFVLLPILYTCVNKIGRNKFW